MRIGSQRSRVPTYALDDHVNGDCEIDQLGRLVKGSSDCRDSREVYVGCERTVVHNGVNIHRTVIGKSSYLNNAAKAVTATMNHFSRAV